MIKTKSKLCACGCNQTGQIYSKGMLKQCFIRLNPPKKIKYKSSIQKIKDKKDAETTRNLHQWFLELWDKRKKFCPVVGTSYVECFESGKKLYSKYYKFNTCCYSHYLPKSRYPKYAFEEWNLEIVDPAIHDQWEIDKEKCPKMFNRLKEIENDLQNDGITNDNM